ncbi:MAG: TolC family protein [Roseivirga sp.]|nr:TolC family protein [Roseivirga sp.]
MQKSIAFVLCGCLLSIGVKAQSSSIEDILQAIEQNNKELKAWSSQLESNKLALKTSNNLPDPQLGAFYLPFGDHVGGDYAEFQLTQSFEFPSVYGARRNLIGEQSARLELDYQVKRQEVLLTARQYCASLIYLNKRKQLEEKRVEQARTVFEHVQELFDKEEVSVLDLNKAKVAWMQEKFKIEHIEHESRNLLLLLKNLNGGKELTFQASEYLDALELPEQDEIWEYKLTRDPSLKLLKQDQVVAQNALKLSKSKTLPNLSTGFNYQGVRGNNFSGVYAGLSLPLWSNRNKVKAAQLRLDFSESWSAANTDQRRTVFEKQYYEYRMLLSKFREYQTTLSGLNSDELLLRSYQAGQITFMEYYMELQFYRQAYDAMLDMENQLYQSRADLLKHQL